MKWSEKYPAATKLLQDFFQNKVVFVSGICFFVIILLSLLSPLIAPQNPYDLLQIDILDAELPPSWLEGGESRFWWGTDTQGRGIWSTVLYGTGISLLIGIFAVILQAFLGIVIGLVAGYFGGLVDAFLMRFADIQLSLSTLMVAIIALAIFQNLFGANAYEKTAIFMLILVIGIGEWPQYARTMRANVLAEKSKEYVDAAHVMGFSTIRVLFRHILPNTMTPLFVISTIQVANAIITEATLSFLGLGMPVTRPSLGSLIRSGFEYIFSGQWWITFFPAMILIILILCINILGDWLRDTLNPRFYNKK
jgi:peptide/nickel transport system permease protein